MSVLTSNLAIAFIHYDMLFSFLIMASTWLLLDRQSFRRTPRYLLEDALLTSTPLMRTAGGGEAVLQKSMNSCFVLEIFN